MSLSLPVPLHDGRLWGILARRIANAFTPATESKKPNEQITYLLDRIFRRLLYFLCSTDPDSVFRRSCTEYPLFAIKWKTGIPAASRTLSTNWSRTCLFDWLWDSSSSSSTNWTANVAGSQATMSRCLLWMRLKASCHMLLFIPPFTFTTSASRTLPMNRYWPLMACSSTKERPFGRGEKNRVFLVRIALRFPAAFL